MGSVLPGSLVATAILFALVYRPLLARTPPPLVSPYSKADLGRRLSAAMIDGALVTTAWMLFRQYASVLYALAGLLYVIFKDSLAGRSVGKFCCGLVVLDVHTGRPCGRVGSATRNILFAIPGVNVSGVLLESTTIVRDSQGQRLGDRLAQTQVVEGLGARDLAKAFQAWWREFVTQLDRPRRGRRRLLR